MAVRARPRSRKNRKAQGEEGLGGTIRFVLTVAIMAWLLRSLIVTPFHIPSGSMLPTLYIGDYLAVAKWPYGYSRYSFPFGFPPINGRILGDLPERGDVVVFRHPVDNSDLIKRVIGLPGDSVAMRRGQLMLNGRAVRREAARHYRLPITANTPCKVVPPAAPEVMQVDGQPLCIFNAFTETLPGGPSYTVLDQVPDGPADDFGPVRVPAGQLFLMGDNRDDSLDSRYSAAEGGIGMVPTNNLIGRAMITFWSTRGSASYWKPWTWFSNLRGARVGNGYTGTAE